MMFTQPFLFNKSAYRCSAHRYLIVLSLIMPQFCKADELVMYRGTLGGQVETYGKVVSADEHEIKFDVECTGNVKKLTWGKSSPSVSNISFNSKCKRSFVYGAGKLGPGCGDFVLVVADFESFLDKFAYDGRTGVIRFFGKAAGSFDVKHGLITDRNGKVTKISASDLATSPPILSFWVGC